MLLRMWLYIRRRPLEISWASSKSPQTDVGQLDSSSSSCWTFKTSHKPKLE